MTYRVTAPLVLAKDQDGHTHHRYEDAVIDWLSDEQAKHLLAEGLVEKISGRSVPKAEQPPEDADGPPKQAAPKADWVDYAVSKGADVDEAEVLTKQELVELYGG
jgi:hypothetical protein